VDVDVEGGCGKWIVESGAVPDLTLESYTYFSTNHVNHSHSSAVSHKTTLIFAKTWSNLMILK